MNAVRRPRAVLFLSFLVAACGGGGGGSPTPTPPATHSISGTVAGAPGAAVKLTGAAERAGTADADGHYQFTDLADGTYAVAPSLSGYSFSPTSTAVTLAGADRSGVDFSGAAAPDPTHAISGTVSGAANVPLALTGSGSATTTTGSGGHYQFAGLSDGQYTVTPSLAGYAFTPASVPLALAGADVPGVDFTATLIPAPTHSISGTAGAPGATVKLSGAMEKTVTADQSGHFQFTGLADGTYAVAPSLSGYTFDPVSTSVTLAGADRSGVTFTASAISAPTHAISGTVSGAVGVSLSLGGTASATTSAGTGGFYQFTGLADGGYTVTPSLSGYTFTPATAPVTLAGADSSGVNFAASPVAAPTYSISGSAGAPNASVALSGTANKVTTAGADGHYQFTGLAEGGYAVTPSLSGYTFSPDHTSVTLAGANRSGVSFTATANPPPTHAIYGNAGVAGATVSLTGPASETTTAGLDGSYQYTGLVDGTYTVTPSLSGYTFSPDHTSVTLAGADRSGVSFTATANPPPTHAISGTVVPMGPAVSLSFSDGSQTLQVPVNADGTYQISGLANGSYTVRMDISPSLVSSCTEWSVSKSVTVKDYDVQAVVFTPSCSVQITGRVSPPQQDVEVDLYYDGPMRKAFTNASGVYTFTSLTGSRIVNSPWPTASGQRTINVGVGNVTGLDFTLDTTNSVILFLTPDTYTGNLGGRNGADGICARTAAPICAGKSSPHAVLSVSNTDTVALMPTTFGLPASTRVRSVNGNTLATNGWDDMFPDVNAALYGNLWVTYWTGALADGSFPASNTCNGWTSSSSSYTGYFGGSNYTDMNWINDGRFGCELTARLLCACW